MFFFKWNNLRILIVVLILKPFATDGTASAQWKQVLDKDNIQVFSKPSTNGINYYKVNATVNTSITELYSFLTDFSRFPEWVNNCSYTKVFQEIKDSSYIYYSYFDMPWPASDRDGVSNLKVVKFSEDSIVVTSVPAKWKVTRKKGVVRVENFEERYELVKSTEGSVILTMEGGYNPGGYIPDWLVRKMMKYGPYDVILKIKYLTEK